PIDEAPVPIPAAAEDQPNASPTAASPPPAATSPPAAAPAAGPRPAPPAAAAPAAPSLEKAEGAAGGSNGNGAVYASPSVRRIARELGIDLHNLVGTGRKGRLTPDDVRIASAAGGGRAAVAGGVPTNGSLAGLGLAPWPVVDF